MCVYAYGYIVGMCTYMGTDREDAVHLLVSQREKIPSIHVSVQQFLFTVIICDVLKVYYQIRMLQKLLTQIKMVPLEIEPFF